MSSLLSGCNSYCTEGGHRGGCRAASLWHHEEAFDSFRPHGRHGVNSFHVSICTNTCCVNSKLNLFISEAQTLTLTRNLIHIVSYVYLVPVSRVVWQVLWPPTQWMLWGHVWWINVCSQVTFCTRAPWTDSCRPGKTKDFSLSIKASGPTGCVWGPGT